MIFLIKSPLFASIIGLLGLFLFIPAEGQTTTPPQDAATPPAPAARALRYGEETPQQNPPAAQQRSTMKSTPTPAFQAGSGKKTGGGLVPKPVQIPTDKQ